MFHLLQVNKTNLFILHYFHVLTRLVLHPIISTKKCLRQGVRIEEDQLKGSIRLQKAFRQWIIDNVTMFLPASVGAGGNGTLLAVAIFNGTVPITTGKDNLSPVLV